MGENGAGKSTRSSLNGVYEDAGKLLFRGRGPSSLYNRTGCAGTMGIGTVFQEIALCPNLTVAENIFIGRSRKALLSEADERKGRTRY